MIYLVKKKVFIPRNLRFNNPHISSEGARESGYKQRIANLGLTKEELSKKYNHHYKKRSKNDRK